MELEETGEGPEKEETNAFPEGGILGGEDGRMSMNGTGFPVRGFLHNLRNILDSEMGLERTEGKRGGRKREGRRRGYYWGKTDE